MCLYVETRKRRPVDPEMREPDGRFGGIESRLGQDPEQPIQLSESKLPHGDTSPPNRLRSDGNLTKQWSIPDKYETTRNQLCVHRQILPGVQKIGRIPDEHPYGCLTRKREHM